MKLELAYPFTEDYRQGYILTSRENRQILILVRFDGSRTSINYARYLMSCHLGRYLTSEEQVDHIDNDKTNDVLENLQILTPAENRAKDRANRNLTRKYVRIQCPVCQTIFDRKHSHTHLAKKGYYTTCSQECRYSMMKSNYTSAEKKELGDKYIIEIYRK